MAVVALADKVGNDQAEADAMEGLLKKSLHEYVKRLLDPAGLAASTPAACQDVPNIGQNIVTREADSFLGVPEGVVRVLSYLWYPGRCEMSPPGVPRDETVLWLIGFDWGNPSTLALFGSLRDIFGSLPRASIWFFKEPGSRKRESLVVWTLTPDWLPDTQLGALDQDFLERFSSALLPLSALLVKERGLHEEWPYESASTGLFVKSSLEAKALTKGAFDSYSLVRAVRHAYHEYLVARQLQDMLVCLSSPNAISPFETVMLMISVWAHDRGLLGLYDERIWKEVPDNKPEALVHGCTSKCRVLCYVHGFQSNTSGSLF